MYGAWMGGSAGRRDAGEEQVPQGHLLSRLTVVVRDGNLGFSGGPIGGRVQSDLDPHSNNPERIAGRRDAARPSSRLRTAVESNNRHATCTSSPPDTNSQRPKQTRGLVDEAVLAPLALAVAGQF
jgi:hypothetical protein